MSSKFKIDRPEIFNGINIYWARPASERDDELREVADIYMNRNKLAEEFEIINLINPHDFIANISKHTGHQEVYKCKHGYLVVISLYANPTTTVSWVEAVQAGFLPYGLLYSTRCCLSMVKLVETKKDLEVLLTAE